MVRGVVTQRNAKLVGPVLLQVDFLCGGRSREFNGHPANSLLLLQVMLLLKGSLGSQPL